MSILHFRWHTFRDPQRLNRRLALWDSRASDDDSLLRTDHPCFPWLIMKRTQFISDHEKNSEFSPKNDGFWFLDHPYRLRPRGGTKRVCIFGCGSTVAEVSSATPRVALPPAPGLVAMRSRPATADSGTSRGGPHPVTWRKTRVASGALACAPTYSPEDLLSMGICGETCGQVETIAIPGHPAGCGVSFL